MSSRLYSYDEVVKRLSRYECRRIFKLPPGFELWETGWKKPFTLRPEPPERYSETQIRAAMVFIAETIPDDWWDSRNGK